MQYPLYSLDWFQASVNIADISVPLRSRYTGKGHSWFSKTVWRPATIEITTSDSSNQLERAPSPVATLSWKFCCILAQTAQIFDKRPLLWREIAVRAPETKIWNDFSEEPSYFFKIHMKDLNKLAIFFKLLSISIPAICRQKWTTLVSVGVVGLFLTKFNHYFS